MYTVKNKLIHLLQILKLPLMLQCYFFVLYGIDKLRLNFISNDFGT